MRIEFLTIPEYKNLGSFSIRFDNTQSTTVVLGRNGTGKSNLIEALVEIFRDLEHNQVPSFAYELAYTCRGRRIDVSADPGRSTKRLTVRVDGESLSVSVFRDRLEELLPSHVFAYYSGWSDRLERHFDASTRRHYDAVLNSEGGDLPLRRLFFCRKEYSQLVLLAFFLSETDTAKSLLQDYLRIAAFDSALFVLKKPWWRSGAPSASQERTGDPRFWFARGAFKHFLARLWSHSLAPLRNHESIERDVRRQAEGVDRLYLYVKSMDDLKGLKSTGESSKELFGYLESLFLSDLIDEVRVSVERIDGSFVKFSQMSEGEQQLLTVLGLMLFTQDDEALYLLDEPDTHLNPVWTYDFLQLLQSTIRADHGQLIVATHNPLMVGTLRKNQVRVLTRNTDRVADDEQADRGRVSVEDRDGVDGTVDSLERREGATEFMQALEPDYDPLGIGIEGLLKSELYGLRSSLAPDVLVKLDRQYSLLGRDELTDAEQSELRSIARYLNSLGVARTHPNPYFESFANALSRTTSPGGRSGLTRSDLADEARIADEVLAEIIAEEGDGPSGIELE
ncbi:MAG TPA: AAA family ATPase [Microthrixaceae bacterium]|nr:AAA family ATPase [uncultured Candidatus Microthrix sp.]HMS13863.1 AAA family ATPase [Microthrixaceae bacterium]HMT23035.1 AAA family ATPase [Microthrixaceae bacterium]HMT59727.1 AAA family ATPase [Microthrixaceae bacterium]